MTRTCVRDDMSRHAGFAPAPRGMALPLERKTRLHIVTLAGEMKLAGYVGGIPLGHFEQVGEVVPISRVEIENHERNPKV